MAHLSSHLLECECFSRIWLFGLKSQRFLSCWLKLLIEKMWVLQWDVRVLWRTCLPTTSLPTAFVMLSRPRFARPLLNFRARYSWRRRHQFFAQPSSSWQLRAFVTTRALVSRVRVRQGRRPAWLISILYRSTLISLICVVMKEDLTEERGIFISEARGILMKVSRDALLRCGLVTISRVANLTNERRRRAAMRMRAQAKRRSCSPRWCLTRSASSRSPTSSASGSCSRCSSWPPLTGNPNPTAHSH